jgi:hypothetical protein
MASPGPASKCWSPFACPRGLGLPAHGRSRGTIYRAFLASESKGEPPLPEVKSPEQSRIRDDLMRLVEVWDTLSVGTKAFLQLQSEQM